LSAGARLASFGKSGRFPDRKEFSMRKIRFLVAAALAALGVAAHAAGGQDVNLDGSAQAHRKPTLATAANRQLAQASVPSAKTEPVDVKAQADADIAARDARARGPRLKVSRQNLKGDDAKRAIAQRTTPNTIDHETAYGDIDHTEQVTNVKVELKK
jgi:hypothetical protein